MPLPFAAIGLGVSAIGGISKMIGGARNTRQGKRELKQLVKSRQEIVNINEGRRISMRGADMANEQIARGTASSIDALRSGGIRGAMGGIQGIQENNNNAALQQGAMVDQAQIQLESEYARDEARVQAMNEQRQMGDESIAQQTINAGRQDMYSGMGDIASGAFSAAALTQGDAKTGDGKDGGGLGAVFSPQQMAANAFGSYSGALAGNLGVMNRPAGQMAGRVGGYVAPMTRGVYS
tara:strand:- start:459 stop:1169 length:711 start_codon:yes stop_codon:yes gene_type:complete